MYIRCLTKFTVKSSVQLCIQFPGLKKNSIHLRYILNHVIKNKVSCKHFEAMNCIFIECLEYFLKLNYDNKRSCKLKIISNAENYFFLTGIPRL